MNAEIITVGSELLLGQIVDTNSTWIAQRLAAIGVNLFYRTAVGDNPARMEDIFRRALERSDVVIVTGGIGPTEDDRTREIAAQVTGRELIVDAGLLQQITERFRTRGFIMTANNEKQAQIPEGAIPVENPNGTAPAFIVEHDGSVLICLPGVPFEMKYLVEHRIIPYLREKFGVGGEVIKSRVLKTCGLGESTVDEMISDLMAKGTNPTVGVLAHPGQVDVRITAKGRDEAGIERMLDEMDDLIHSRLKDHVFGRDDQTMEGALGVLVREAGITVASVENLTGGLLSQKLLSACADSFSGGVIANGETALQRLLDRSDVRSTGAFEVATDEGSCRRELTRTLVRDVKSRSGADVVVAVMCFPDPTREASNLSPGDTLVMVYNGREFLERGFKFAGRGGPDQMRATMYALDAFRRYLMRQH
ncbi:MAG: CinA family nicotinamide mononucleotide deamidase-related protein [Desulfobacterales bacterium]|nr:CinA family nicotinamide mononucleotide deamidase-related protein [Desulfobacterales bacterium]